MCFFSLGWLDYFSFCHSLFAAFPGAIPKTSCYHSVVRVKNKNRKKIRQYTYMTNVIQHSAKKIIGGRGGCDPNIFSLQNEKRPAGLPAGLSVCGPPQWDCEQWVSLAFLHFLMIYGDRIILRFILVRYNCHISWWPSAKTIANYFRTSKNLAHSHDCW